MRGSSPTGCVVWILLVLWAQSRTIGGSSPPSLVTTGPLDPASTVGGGPRRWRSRSPKPQDASKTSNLFDGQDHVDPLHRAPGMPPGGTGVFNSSTTIHEAARITSIDKQHETTYVAECVMPTSLGKFRMRSYRYRRLGGDSTPSMEPIVVIHGDVSGAENVIVRVHDQCFTSEVFGSRRCDCREQLHESLKLIRKETGIVIYLQQEGRGIGISNKVAAYSLQDSLGVDTVDANLHLGFPDELREYNCVPDILANLDIKSIRLVTNNPYKIDQLTALGVVITDRVLLNIPTNEFNIGYIRSKRDRMQHLFPKDLAPQGATHPSTEGFCKFFQETATAAAARVLTSISGGVEEANSDSYPVLAGADNDALSSRSSSSSSGGGDGIEASAAKGYAFGKKSVEDAVNAIRRGQVVVVVDDENRENEGDLIMAAEKATPATIGFIVRHTSGVLCAGMEGQRLDALHLPPMVVNNEDPKKTAYTVSVDCRHGTTTGISASDRAMTFRALADPSFRAQDFQRPGHVFPLRYRPGGVLVRAGHTEASVDLAKLAGLAPAGVLAEVVNDDGSIMHLPGLKALAQEYNLILTSVQDLIAYRLELEKGGGGGDGERS